MFNWTGASKCRVSKVPGTQQLGKPSFPQVPGFPLGTAFLAKEKPPLWLQKVALCKNKMLASQDQKFKETLSGRQDRL